jgi:hypothetical protein
MAPLAVVTLLVSSNSVSEAPSNSRAPLPRVSGCLVPLAGDIHLEESAAPIRHDQVRYI